MGSRESMDETRKMEQEKREQKQRRNMANMDDGNDTERMDWLEAGGMLRLDPLAAAFGLPCWYVIAGADEPVGGWPRFRTIRKAIDVARKGERGKA